MQLEDKRVQNDCPRSAGICGWSRSADFPAWHIFHRGAGPPAGFRFLIRLEVGVHCGFHVRPVRKSLINIECRPGSGRGHRQLLSLKMYGPQKALLAPYGHQFRQHIPAGLQQPESGMPAHPSVWLLAWVCTAEREYSTLCTC